MARPRQWRDTIISLHERTISGARSVKRKRKFRLNLPVTTAEAMVLFYRVEAAGSMARANERRNLALIRESAATTRVLDLAFIQDKFGDDPEYKAKPMFECERLNDAIIMKHALRASERHIFNGRRLTATKVLFPLARSDLSLGGESLFVGERDFARLLGAKVGIPDRNQMQNDLDVLTLLDELPSFDPFLMRERLRQIGREPARCYFDVSTADTHRMQKFVSSAIAALVELAFADKAPAPRELSVRLADKLMTDENSTSLEPLRATLKLSGEEYREGVFAWKGFLYYKWVVSEWGEGLPTLARSILGARIMGASREDMTQLGESRQSIVKIMSTTMGRVYAALGQYDDAFQSLSEGKPAAFRTFLLSAPQMFLEIGEAVGIIKHIDSFWRFRFPAGRVPTMEVNEALEIFSEFEATLSGVSAGEKSQAAAI